MEERQHLVEKAQPFGQVSEVKAHGVHPAEGALSSKGLGSDKVILNHAENHAPSYADPNPGAKAQAMAGHDNPFGPVRR